MITGLWRDLTIGQALIVVAIAGVLLWAINRTLDSIRHRRGLPPLGGWQHCEHCTAVDGLRDQVDALISCAHDSYGALEVIRDYTGRTATAIDELAADEKPVAIR